MSNEPAEALAFSMLTTPRPISEYHEDMGSVLWWCWETKPPLLRDRVGEELGKDYGRWLGEAPYVGTPNDCGFTVEAHTTTRVITQMNQEHDPDPVIQRIDVGGWPGYHTHFTMIPVPASPSISLEEEKSHG